MDINFEELKTKSKQRTEKMINHKYTYEDIKEKTKNLLMSESDKYMIYFSEDKTYSYDEVLSILGEYFNERSIRMELRVTF